MPFLVRCGIALSLVLAMSVGWPADVTGSRYMVLLFAVAVYPAFAPRGRGATVAILVVVLGWIVDTTWFDARVALWRVLRPGPPLLTRHPPAPPPPGPP